MSYYMSTSMTMGFDDALTRVKEELKKEGFGILTEADIQATLKEKLGVGFRRYRILGACNPPYAYKALQSEPRIGLLLPCNVIVQETEPGRVEVAAIDPVESMSRVDNQLLLPVATEIQAKMRKVIAALG
jgi:uncharacterized protein (DUF302 family)